MNRYIKKLALIHLLSLMMLIWPGFSFAQYKLEKVGEFKINSLVQIDLIDYFPKEEMFLGYTNKRSKGLEITLVKEDGEIVISRNMKGQGPEQYGSTLNCLGFSDEGNIWALTPHQLLLYDQKLKLKERSRYESNGQIYIYGGSKPFSYFYKNGDKTDFLFITNPSGASKFAGVSDFREKKLIEIFHKEGNAAYEVAPVTERPHYEYLDESIDGIYFPIYTLDRGNSRLYMTTSLDNEITVINLNTNQVISKIKINHGEFKILKSNQITRKSLPSYDHITLAAYNHNIFKLDDGLMALEYIREIPYGTYENKIADDPSYHHFRDPEYHRLILFNQSGQLTKDMKIPYGKITMSLPGNRLLIKLENPDIEEDFIRYGIYKLTDTNE
ncbi:hypothetical protein [Cyclobacterium roseum]|uniref:hypothetical protein n=1 Tax=Cyclobacterium roseum TaxID=2666137 RepID=UPI001390BA8E|nr:hypothetical protein [Cyclobacterium roseum]